MLKYCPWRSYKFILKNCDFWISLHAVKIKMTKSTTTKTASKWFGNENFSMDVRIISCIAVMLSREFFAQSYCLTAIFVVVVLIWFLHFFSFTSYTLVVCWWVQFFGKISERKKNITVFYIYFIFLTIKCCSAVTAAVAVVSGSSFIQMDFFTLSVAHFSLCVFHFRHHFPNGSTIWLFLILAAASGQVASGWRKKSYWTDDRLWKATE